MDIYITYSETIGVVSHSWRKCWLISSDHLYSARWVVCSFFVLCLILSCVSCTFALWFLYGGHVPLFVSYVWLCSCSDGNMDDGLLENDFVCVMSNSLTTLDMAEPIEVVVVLNKIYCPYDFQIWDKSWPTYRTLLTKKMEIALGKWPWDFEQNS